MPRIASSVVVKKELTIEQPQKSEPITLNSLNSLLICPLCNGYLINAHTLTECSHAFCKSCLYNYSRQMVLSDKPLACPICGTTQQLFHTVIHGVRPDHALQNIVYKLVPGLISREVQRRKEFINEMQKLATKETSENGNSSATDKKVKSVSLSLEFVDRTVKSLNRSESPIVQNTAILNEPSTTGAENTGGMTSSYRSGRIYLRCPPELTVFQMKKFITVRFSLSTCSDIALLSSSDEAMHDSLSLGEVAFLLDYNEERGPLRLFFSIVEYRSPPNLKRRMRNASGGRQSPQVPVSKIKFTCRPAPRRSRIAVVQQKEREPSLHSSSTSSESSEDSESSGTESDSGSSVEGARQETAPAVTSSSPPATIVPSSSQTKSSTSYSLVSSDPEKPKLFLRRVSTQDPAPQQQQQPSSTTEETAPNTDSKPSTIT